MGVARNLDNPHIAHHVQWYTVGGIVLAAVGFLVGLSVCAYAFYRRRQRQAVSERPGIGGWKEVPRSTSGNMKKSPSVRSTSSIKSNASSTKSTSGTGTRALPPQGGSEGGVQGGVRKSPSLEPCADKPEPVADAVNQALLVTEKADTLKEKTEDDLKLRRLGELQFAVEYDQQKTALVVTVVRATDLPPKDVNIGSSDPYVKLQLLPEKRHKVKTRVLRKTLNPVYDEIFTFYGIDYNQIPTVTLHFVVLSFDRFSRDDIIGEVIYPLADADLAGKMPLTLTKQISPRHIKMHSQGRGELLVSLCYQPAANRLTVVVLKARNLPKMDITGLSDPYVKIYLLYNGQRIAKKKTHVKKRTLNPVFNESFLFDVPCNEGLANISLELLALDWDRMTKNEVVGRLEIGTKVGGPQARHWHEVMNCPRKQIAEWHKLQE